MDELDYLVEGRPNSGFCYACLQEANNYSVHQKIIGAGQRPSHAAEEAGDAGPVRAFRRRARGPVVLTARRWLTGRL